jgi:hypothetical protein
LAFPFEGGKRLKGTGTFGPNRNRVSYDTWPSWSPTCKPNRNHEGRHANESVSKVVRRHLATKTDTFLYKKIGLKNLFDIGAAKSTRIERQINQTRFQLHVAPALGQSNTLRAFTQVNFM